MGGGDKAESKGKLQRAAGATPLSPESGSGPPLLGSFTNLPVTRRKNQSAYHATRPSVSWHPAAGSSPFHMAPPPAAEARAHPFLQQRSSSRHLHSSCPHCPNGISAEALPDLRGVETHHLPPGPILLTPMISRHIFYSHVTSDVSGCLLSYCLSLCTRGWHACSMTTTQH